MSFGFNLFPLIGGIYKSTQAYFSASTTLPDVWAQFQDADFQTNFYTKESRFIKIIGLTKKVHFIAVPNYYDVLAIGANSSKGTALMIFTPNLRKVEPDGTNGLIKRELTYIANNHYVISPSIGAITSFVCALLPISTALGSLGLALAAPWAVENIFGLFCDIRADDTAIANATNEQLLGMRRILQANLNILNASRPKWDFWTKIYVNVESIPTFHQHFNSEALRIRKIEKELAKRECAIDEACEKNKITGIEATMLETLEQLKKADGSEIEAALNGLKTT